MISIVWKSTGRFRVVLLQKPIRSYWPSRLISGGLFLTSLLCSLSLYLSLSCSSEVYNAKSCFAGMRRMVSIAWFLCHKELHKVSLKVTELVTVDLFSAHKPYWFFFFFFFSNTNMPLNSESKAAGYYTPSMETNVQIFGCLPATFSC